MDEKLKYSLWITVLGAVFFLPFLGGVRLFDWDEINFAEAAREMIVLGDFFRVHINFQPFWEKPPLFFWLQALSMYVFGVGEYAARFPNAICGILSMLFLFRIGNKLFNPSFGITWALVYLGSVLPHLYFKSGIIDPWFNLFIFASVYAFIQFYWKKEAFEFVELKHKYLVYLIASGLLLGLAILTKGPAAFIIVCLVFFVYWILQSFRLFVSIPHFLLFCFAAFFITLIWFGIETAKNGPWFVETFTRYQYRLFSTPDAGHEGFFGYHFVVMLFGCFPASVFAIRALYRMPQDYPFRADFRTWMLILLAAVLVLFSVVQSKIVHYSSLAYFPLTYLATLSIYHIFRGDIILPPWLPWVLGVIGLIYVTACLALPYFGMHPDSIRPLFGKDPFAMANLDAQVVWDNTTYIPGIYLLLLMVFSIYWIMKKRFTWGLPSLFVGNALFITLALIFFIKRIEGYSQAAAMEFFQDLEGKDCYVTTVGYKSYAHLFYFTKPQGGHPDSHNEDWLLHGVIDKDVYVITKIDRAERMRDLEQFEEIGNKNGFVFFKREVERTESAH